MFVPLVAHDLKAPLRRLERLAIEAQRDSGRDGEQLLSLVSQARRARSLVDDLLSWCRLAEDRRERERIFLEPFVTGIWEDIPKPAGFRLVLDCRVDTVLVDAAALGIVLRNILENAVLHHDRPEATVTVEIRRLRRRLEFRIRDDGPGMSRERATAVAALLADPEAAPMRSGLGLRLVAEALRYLDGRARLGPAGSGRGTLIVISLPATA